MKTTFRIFILMTAIILGHNIANCQSRSFDLVKMYNDKTVTVYNREITTENSDSKNALILSEEEGEGLVWINGVNFSTGTIEVDLKGQDVFQHSFLGIAFHAVNDSTFDAIYFRPFQFHTDDAVRKSHGVQYISLPQYTWQKLRAEQNGLYENEVSPAPDPDNWFHAKLVIKEKEVLVYINGGVMPVLKVPLKNERRSGMIALYTADRSGGTFANLVIKD